MFEDYTLAQLWREHVRYANAAHIEHEFLDRALVECPDEENYIRLTRNAMTFDAWRAILFGVLWRRRFNAS